MILLGGEVRVDLRPVSSLLPHEDTIPEQLERMVAQVKRDRVQKDPLIVDRETGTVLDGMHRLGAFARLGVENVVCSLVDYSSVGIVLKRWARVYRTSQGGRLTQALNELGVNKAATLTDAFGLLEGRKTPVAVIGRSGCRVAGGRTGLDEGFKVVRTLDGVARTLGWQRSFVAENDVDVPLQDEWNAVVLVQRINKQDVVDAARGGRLFPCKTSMHLIDPRPVALDFPVDELNDATPGSLERLMARRTLRMLPPQSEYEGRRYKERLLLMNER